MAENSLHGSDRKLKGLRYYLIKKKEEERENKGTKLQENKTPNPYKLENLKREMRSWWRNNSKNFYGLTQT